MDEVDVHTKIRLDLPLQPDVQLVRPLVLQVRIDPVVRSRIEPDAAGNIVLACAGVVVERIYPSVPRRDALEMRRNQLAPIAAPTHLRHGFATRVELECGAEPR